MKENSSVPETKAKRTTGKREREEQSATDERAAGSSDAPPSPAQDEGLDGRMLKALHAASDKKALDLVALDLRAIASFTDFFLIATGTNPRQVQAIADAVVEQLKNMGNRAARVEGYNAAEWVLLDYGDFIFHIFEEKARRFYDLERLWRDAARTALPAELAGGNRSSNASGGNGGDSENGNGAGGSLRNEQ